MPVGCAVTQGEKNMKRSQINYVIEKAKERLDEYKITLPMFGYWTVEDWKEHKGEIGRIKERMLGWDVTDYGTDDFYRRGAVLFTIRNGDKNDKLNKAPYAEKYIIMDDSREQEIPLHYHISKTEDIINRAGGVLVVELYHEAKEGGLDKERDVDVYMDGVKRTFAAGEKIFVTPGNSITIEPYVYHRFYAECGKGMLIVGEVSKVNDDNNDNVFLDDDLRFCPIEEDEPKVHPLVNEYDEL